MIQEVKWQNAFQEIENTGHAEGCSGVLKCKVSSYTV